MPASLCSKTLEGSFVSARDNVIGHVTVLPPYIHYRKFKILQHVHVFGFGVHENRSIVRAMIMSRFDRSRTPERDGSMDRGWPTAIASRPVANDFQGRTPVCCGR